MSSASAGTLAQASLRARVRETERPAKARALLLIAPLFLFLAVNFVLPIATSLLRSVQEPELPAVLPQTAAVLRQWDGQGLPDERTAATFIAELVTAREADTLSAVANRLNFDVNGFRS